MQLDGDEALEIGIPRAIDAAERPVAELLDQVVLTPAPQYRLRGRRRDPDGLARRRRRR